MFSIFTKFKIKFDRGLDEGKLREFKKMANNVNSNKLYEYCEEIHYIMQRHFTNEKMITIC